MAVISQIKMLKLVIFLVTILVTLFGKKYASPIESGYSVEYFDGIINEVKKAGASWEAGHNFESNEEIHNLMGSLDLIEKEEREQQFNNGHESCVHSTGSGFAEQKVGHAMGHTHSFDGLQSWKKICPSVRHIWNQGRCASDWVIAPVSAFTDRLCIASNGTKQVTISPETPLACCKTCGKGCKNGYAQEVNKYLVSHGGVSGGDFDSHKGCQPYSLWPSRHAKYFQRPKVNAPQCKDECTNPKYQKDFDSDIIKGRKAFSYQCPFCAASELKRNGPITATMVVYEDFFTYKTGIYHHVTGKAVGKATIKLVGYNDENPKNKYWIAVNSWGKRWGDRGTFKIKRAVDECMIEGYMQGVYVFKENSDSSSSSSSSDDSDDDDDEEDNSHDHDHDHDNDENQKQ